MYFLTFLCLYTNSLYFRGQHARDRSLTRVWRTPSLCWQGMRREVMITRGRREEAGGREDQQKTAGEEGEDRRREILCQQIEDGCKIWKTKSSTVSPRATGFCRRIPASSETLSYMLRGSENCSSRCIEPSWLESIHLHLTGKDPADVATHTCKTHGRLHTHKRTHTRTHARSPQGLPSYPIHTLTMHSV